MSWGIKLCLGGLALAPLGFLTVGLVDGYDAIRFNSVAEPTKAEVIRFVGGHYDSRAKSHAATFPELRYTTKEGEQVIAVSSSSSDSEFSMPMDTGDILQARYDPGNVTDIRLWTPTQMFIGPGFMVFFGLIFSGMVAIAWRLFANTKW